MNGVTRRSFLRTTALTTAGGCLGGGMCALASGEASKPSADGIGTLVDLTRCIGCRACVRACSRRNSLPMKAHVPSAWEGEAQGLVYDRWTDVTLVATGEGDERVPVKRQCMHCLEPACVSVCPVGALQKLPSGAVIYHPERCIGCRYCVFACPFGIPKFQWNSGTQPVIGKCQFCAQDADLDGPACVRSCPTGALKSGRRADMLAEAHARVNARPDRYIKHIYGEEEAGGTAWLYLSGRPFEKLGFPSRLPKSSLPQLTWMALKILPGIVTGLAMVLSVASLVFRRRDDDSGNGGNGHAHGPASPRPATEEFAKQN